MRILLLLALLVSFSTVHAEEITKESVVTYINSERSTPLVVNHGLDLAAQAKAEDMTSKGYFAHIENGLGLRYWLLGRYNFKYAGENLATGFTDVESMHKAFMASPTHRANIVSGNYKEVGVGIATSSQGVFVVQMFGAR